jgi:hypothetical protein
VKLVTAGEKGAKFGKESVRSRLIGEIAIETARGIETVKGNAIVPRRGDLVPETGIASDANDRAGKMMVFAYRDVAVGLELKRKSSSLIECVGDVGRSGNTKGFAVIQQAVAGSCQ